MGAIPVTFNPKTRSTSRHDSIHEGEGAIYALAVDKLSNGSVSPQFDFRRRTHSFGSDSEKSHEFVMHRIQHFDEKDAFESTDHGVQSSEEQKMRFDIERDLMHNFEKEKQEMNDKYETLKKQHDQLQQKMDDLRVQYDQEMNRSRLSDDGTDGYEVTDKTGKVKAHRDKVVEKRNKAIAKKIEKEDNCSCFFPWQCTFGQFG